MEKVSGRHFDSDDDVIASDDQFQEVQDADFYKKKASVCSKPAGQSLKMEEEVWWKIHRQVFLKVTPSYLRP